MKFTTQYKRKSVQKVFTKPSLTDQSFKQECDLGFIVENYVKNGQPLPVSNMTFGDTTSVKDFQEAQYIVSEAKSNFEQLPSKIRDEFKTVENYLDFISKPENLKESYEKGLINPDSVDLKDVYPDHYGDKEVVDTPVVSDNVVETPPSSDTSEK